MAPLAFLLSQTRRFVLMFALSFVSQFTNMEVDWEGGKLKAFTIDGGSRLRITLS